MGTSTAALETVKFYIKSGVDGERMGACPFCQRVYMVLLIKAQHKILNFKIFISNPAKLPPEMKDLGLKHLPAIIHGDDGYDTVDDIIGYLDQRFPGGNLEYKNPEAELATKDIFSRFCYYVKSVSQDSSGMTSALQTLNNFLEQSFVSTPIDSPPSDKNRKSKSKQSLCGEQFYHLDCEVLPKLQHLRVASKHLKNYEIPTHFKGLWRFLYTAYSDEVFKQTCPCDQEIILHWHDRPETPKLSPKIHSVLAKENTKFSFDIPVHASIVQLL